MFRNPPIHNIHMFMHILVYLVYTLFFQRPTRSIKYKIICMKNEQRVVLKLSAEGYVVKYPKVSNDDLVLA